jgi:hypothetical protein
MAQQRFLLTACVHHALPRVKTRETRDTMRGADELFRPSVRA